MKQILLVLAFALYGVQPAAAVQERQPLDPELRELLKKAAHESDSFVDRFDGEVWLTDMASRLEKKVPDPDFRIALLKNIHYEAKRARIEPELVLSVIQVESNLRRVGLPLSIEFDLRYASPIIGTRYETEPAHGLHPH